MYVLNRKAVLGRKLLQHSIIHTRYTRYTRYTRLYLYLSISVALPLPIAYVLPLYHTHSKKKPHIICGIPQSSDSFVETIRLARIALAVCISVHRAALSLQHTSHASKHIGSGNGHFPLLPPLVSPASVCAWRFLFILRCTAWD